MPTSHFGAVESHDPRKHGRITLVDGSAFAITQVLPANSGFRCKAIAIALTAARQAKGLTLDRTYHLTVTDTSCQISDLPASQSE